MDLKKYETYLDIPYIKLKIHIVFQEDTILPKNKVSALRGGMGEMLLRGNCIKDRKCEKCDFEKECIVRRTVYTKMEKKPSFMQGNDSVGYLIECEDYETDYDAGDDLYFNLILFGKNLVYFSQYLQAFYQLGTVGLGKYQSKFFIYDIYTDTGCPLLVGNEVRMDNYKYETVSQYVDRRLKRLKKNGCQYEMRFITPFTVKYQGKFIEEFQSEAIFQSLFRRILMMDYFVENYQELPRLTEYPLIISQTHRKCIVKRYSSTQDSKINLVGIKGTIRFEEMPEEYLSYLLAGELLHIGKNSSFGFGKYLFL